MRLFIFKFRPSSHSVDLTVFALFKDKRSAMGAFAAAKRLLDEGDWRFDEFWLTVKGRLVYVKTPTAYAIGDIKDVMRSFNALMISVEKRVPALIFKAEPGVAGEKAVRRKAGGKAF